MDPWSAPVGYGIVHFLSREFLNAGTREINGNTWYRRGDAYSNGRAATEESPHYQGWRTPNEAEPSQVPVETWTFLGTISS
jgi:hypothetical protein